MRYLIALLLTGCVNSYEKMPFQDKANFIVWNTIYNQKQEVPDIEWVIQKDLNCQLDEFGYHGFTYNKDCVAGLAWEEGFVKVAFRDGDSISDTSYVHEMYHMFLYHTNGFGNEGHSNPGFGIAYGHEYGIVDVAREMLKENEL